MSLQMSIENEEIYKWNAFDEATKIVDELFEEIDKYHDQELVVPTNLSNEINAYQEDETGTEKPLDESVVATIHSWNTQTLKSKMMNVGLIIVRGWYKVLLNVSLCNPTAEM